MNNVYGVSPLECNASKSWLSTRAKVATYWNEFVSVGCRGTRLRQHSNFWSSKNDAGIGKEMTQKGETLEGLSIAIQVRGENIIIIIRDSSPRIKRHKVRAG